MPRKPKANTTVEPIQTEPVQSNSELATQTLEEQQPDQNRQWGNPYKALFTSATKGFEMGENRQYKQRVFLFNDKPDEQMRQALKENGFTYRPAEKAWTIQASATTRELSDRLAREFAGVDQSMSR